jgi:hypothetical protein
MSCEKGFRAIMDEADWQMSNDPDILNRFKEKLSNLPNHYHRAMVTYLDHRGCWQGALRFYHADSLPYWRKRKNMGHAPAAVDRSSIELLASRIREFFHDTEGRGSHCVVEPFRRGNLDYFFAYPEDYSQQSIEWVKGEFDERPHNPAFEVVFVYSQTAGTLDLNFRGSYKAVEPLQAIFAETILKLDELPPDPKDDRVYDLSPIGQKEFNFNYTAGSGIQNVTVKKLRLSSRVKKGDRITLEADTSENTDAVYELMDRIKNAGELHHYNVTQVELVASIVGDDDGPAKSVTIRITHPNSCSLKYDDVGLKLREMLEASGIEPKVAAESDT